MAGYYDHDRDWLERVRRSGLPLDNLAPEYLLESVRRFVSEHYHRLNGQENKPLAVLLDDKRGIQLAHHLTLRIVFRKIYAGVKNRVEAYDRKKRHEEEHILDEIADERLEQRLQQEIGSQGKRVALQPSDFCGCMGGDDQ